MKNYARIAVLFSLVMSGFGLAISAASAQSDYPFKLHNRSQGWTISGFQTFQDGKWSQNWLNGSVKSGETASLDWNSNAGDCVLRFRVSWVDYDAQEFRTDFCKVKNLYMLNEGFRAE